MNKENLALVFFVALFIFSISMLVIGGSQLTGHATSGSTVSNVTIVSYLSISMSQNLSSGILFGSVDTLPATDINATHNYDGPTSGTSMNITVSTDSNVNVDFCTKANAGMQTSGSDIIGIGNETYSNATTVSSTVPALGSQVPLTASYVKSGFNVTRGGNNYYRFWLDIPAAQAPGTYNNTVSFEGLTTGGAC